MKTFSLNKQKSIYFYGEPVKMSCSFDGLSKIVIRELQRKPLSGDAYLFLNKKKTYAKVLYHHRNGMCIYAKRLDAGAHFDACPSGDITVKQMLAVIEQVSVAGKTKLKRAA